MSFGIIYKVENAVTGKVYIGQTTTSLARRWAAHLCEAKSDRYHYPFYRALRKYGEGAFRVSALSEHTCQESLDLAEIEAIQAHRALDQRFGYNLREGGSNGRLSPESIRKGALARTGEKHFRYGKPLSAEHRAKLSEAGKGRVCSPNTREKLAAAGKGRVFSTETRKRIGDSKRGHRMPCHVRRVQCIETGDVYGSMRLASAAAGVSTASMCRHVAGKQKLSVGKNFALVKA